MSENEKNSGKRRNQKIIGYLLLIPAFIIVGIFICFIIIFGILIFWESILKPAINKPILSISAIIFMIMCYAGIYLTDDTNYKKEEKETE